MAEEKTPNPDAVALEDVQRMTSREFKMYTFLKLNGMDHKLSKIDNRLWWVLGSAVMLGVVAILAAVL